MSLTLYSETSGNIMNDILSGLENWCIEFNKFILISFIFLKYIFVFMLLSVGILTLLRLRGVYMQTRLKSVEKENDQLKKPRLILGVVYIFLGIGVLFNFLTYFLIFCLDPLPDRLIFNFINFSGYINSKDMNRIEDINAAKYPHEKTIYYCVALGSFFAISDLVLSLWYLINNNRFINNPRATMEYLVAGVIGGILCGFTTCLPFFL